MSPTRRNLLRFAAAAFSGAALPMGHRPASLAAESDNAVDVLDRADAEAEIVDREKWHLFQASETPGNGRCAQLFVERHRDGTARLIFEVPERPKWDDRAAWETEAGRFTVDDRRVLHELRLDAETLESID